MAVLAITGPTGRTLEPFSSFEEAVDAMDTCIESLEASGYRVESFADAAIADGGTAKGSYLFQVFE